jgi:hypothetical protein
VSDLERARFQVPDRLTEHDLPDRYRQPGFFTPAGQRDRQHEGRHVVRMRDLQRDAIEGVAAQAWQEIELNAWIESRSRAMTDAKFEMMRTQRESEILAGEDPVLKAKFAILDDEFFRDLRSKFNRWL